MIVKKIMSGNEEVVLRFHSENDAEEVLLELIHNSDRNDTEWNEDTPDDFMLDLTLPLTSE
jgi:hypothetical protein